MFANDGAAVSPVPDPSPPGSCTHRGHPARLVFETQDTPGATARRVPAGTVAQARPRAGKHVCSHREPKTSSAEVPRVDRLGSISRAGCSQRPGTPPSLYRAPPPLQPARDACTHSSYPGPPTRSPAAGGHRRAMTTVCPRHRPVPCVASRNGKYHLPLRSRRFGPRMRVNQTRLSRPRSHCVLDSPHAILPLVLQVPHFPRGLLPRPADSIARRRRVPSGICGCLPATPLGTVHRVL